MRRATLRQNRQSVHHGVVDDGQDASARSPRAATNASTTRYEYFAALHGRCRLWDTGVVILCRERVRSHSATTARNVNPAKHEPGLGSRACFRKAT